MSDTHERNRITSVWGLLVAFTVANTYLFLMAFLVIWVVLPSLWLGLTPIVIESGSMEPRIDRGDVVLVSDSLPVDDLERGTVVTFEDRSADRLVTHRVQRRNSDGTYQTAGDANREADSTPLQSEQIVGVARLLIPRIALPVVWLGGNLTLFAIWAAGTVAASIAATRSASATKASHPAPTHRGTVHDTDRGRRRRLVFAPRRASSRLRAWTPIVIALLAASGIRPIGLGTLAAITTALAILVADPRGPEIRIGRWRRRGITILATLRGRQSAAGTLTLVVLALTVSISTTPSSVAAFTDSTGRPNNSFMMGTQCPSPGSVTVGSDDDIFVNEASPTSNYKLDADLRVSPAPGARARSLLRFIAFPTIPANCEVVEAQLRLIPSAQTGRTVSVSRINAVWSEDTVTWNTQPTADAPYAATLVTTTGAYINLDVRDIVADWLTGSPNHGVSLTDSAENTSTNQTVFRSRNSAGPEPVLFIRWD